LIIGGLIIVDIAWALAKKLLFLAIVVVAIGEGIRACLSFCKHLKIRNLKSAGTKIQRGLGWV